MNTFLKRLWGWMDYEARPMRQIFSFLTNWLRKKIKRNCQRLKTYIYDSICTTGINQDLVNNVLSHIRQMPPLDSSAETGEIEKDKSDKSDTQVSCDEYFGEAHSGQGRTQAGPSLTNISVSIKGNPCTEGSGENDIPESSLEQDNGFYDNSKKSSDRSSELDSQGDISVDGSSHGHSGQDNRYQQQDSSIEDKKKVSVLQRLNSVSIPNFGRILEDSSEVFQYMYMGMSNETKSNHQIEDSGIVCRIMIGLTETSGRLIIYFKMVDLAREILLITNLLEDSLKEILYKSAYFAEIALRISPETRLRIIRTEMHKACVNMNLPMPCEQKLTYIIDFPHDCRLYYYIPVLNGGALQRKDAESRRVPELPLGHLTGGQASLDHVNRSGDYDNVQRDQI